jgi:fructosamine-3-kinase
VTLPAGATEARPVSGGDLNESWCVRLADGRRAFVKTRAQTAPGEYAAEARALRWLAAPGAIDTPQVLEVHEQYLVLEWIEHGDLGAAGEEALGRGLAAIHAAGAPHFGDPFVDTDADGGAGSARIGSLRLPNDPSAKWSEFYVSCRLEPLTRMAAERRAITEGAVRAIGSVCGRIDELAGPEEPPARLHGDLWWGNVLADATGRPWLIDPSAYGGHREVDLAMLALFGAPRPRVLAAYCEVHPLPDGARERVELWQLAPLLVHAVLFGGGYGAAAERAALKYCR